MEHVRFVPLRWPSFLDQVQLSFLDQVQLSFDAHEEACSFFALVWARIFLQPFQQPLLLSKEFCDGCHRDGSPAVEAWADSVRRHDVTGIRAHHEQDIVMFDVPRPLQSRGIDEYKKTWDLFFRYHKPSQAFDIEELAITAGEDVGFAFAIVRCGSGTFSGPPEEGGFLFRLTIGLRKIEGDWRITHEHHSVPSTD
jgi:ketosteroid isomerase-like protein